MSRFLIPYSTYVKSNFSLVGHMCGIDCNCVALACNRHWQWKDGSGPRKESVGYQLTTWQAFRGDPMVVRCDKEQRYMDNYNKIIEVVRPLGDTTIFCHWPEDVIVSVFEEVINLYCGYTVPTTKTLHFFVPDLFLILDRGQTWSAWKAEMKESRFGRLPSKIDDMKGREYAALLKHVKYKISSAIRTDKPFALGGSPAIKAPNVEELRMKSPLVMDEGEELPNTHGKVIDNVIRNMRLRP